jgi:hypothetical protein
MKHVQYFLDSANDASITSKYSNFLWSQYAAVYHNALNSTHDVGSVWYAPNRGGSLFGPQASASGLEAVLSTAKVCHTFDQGDQNDSGDPSMHLASPCSVVYPVTRSFDH